MKTKKINTFWKLFPLLFILVTVLIFTVQYGVPIEFLLTLGTLSACIIAYFAGYKWEDMENAFIKKVVDTWIGVLIFILIGIVVGSWVYSGTVPMLIYYGIKLIHPSFIPVMAFIVTSFLSVFTGTSWGSASTAGVAFIGIAQATNTPLPLVAGAVISGAYLGDKNSPISDTTVLAAMGAGTTLSNHIKTMLANTIPAAILAALVFTVLGLNAADSNVNISNLKEAQEILTSLEQIFNFNILLLVPPVFVLIASVKGVNPVITMFIGSLIAIIIGAVTQDFGLINSMKSFVTGFNISMSPTVNPDNIPDTLHFLLNRGGMISTMPSVLFLILALTYGAMLELIGTFNTLIELLIKITKGARSLIFTTWLTTFTINSALSSLQFTFLTLGSVLKTVYDKYNVNRGVLSRTMEEGGTLTEVLLPWTVTGVYMTSILGVHTLQYMPYSFFNLISIGISFIYMLTLPKFAVKINKN
ncbi:Na+/H+ antiporter NhaC [Brachyspira hampsonii]|uniref:Na+/H+ antiporter NhaC n=1 Tax=Brachyspira hampsonii TaxID=1287055 RepID=A0A1E5NE30_9SPIR|nr:Na+/H+ antiporter NhaC [Brachyspira hampsonii]OEJ14408.1 Na+/H+ antiporter NhaC [Brachyspira hampsonii]